MNIRKTSFVAVALLSLATSTSNAQAVPKREGFWFNIGLGVGSLGCSDCEVRESGISGGLALGATVSKHWLIGLFSNAWTRSEDGVTVTASTVVAGARFYPSATNGFFINGGIGIGALDLTLSGYGNLRETGAGALFGFGYDIPLGSAASLTAFWNGASMASANGDANFGQLGIGVTIH